MIHSYAEFFLDTKPRLGEELEHRMDQETTEQKEQQKERGETRPAEPMHKIDRDGQTRDAE